MESDCFSYKSCLSFQHHSSCGKNSLGLDPCQLGGNLVYYRLDQVRRVLFNRLSQPETILQNTHEQDQPQNPKPADSSTPTDQSQTVGTMEEGEEKCGNGEDKKEEKKEKKEKEKKGKKWPKNAAEYCDLIAVGPNHVGPLRHPFGSDSLTSPSVAARRASEFCSMGDWRTIAFGKPMGCDGRCDGFSIGYYEGGPKKRPVPDDLGLWLDAVAAASLVSSLSDPYELCKSEGSTAAEIVARQAMRDKPWLLSFSVLARQPQSFRSLLHLTPRFFPGGLPIFFPENRERFFPSSSRSSFFANEPPVITTKNEKNEKKEEKEDLDQNNEKSGKNEKNEKNEKDEKDEKNEKNENHENKKGGKNRKKKNKKNQKLLATNTEKVTHVHNTVEKEKYVMTNDPLFAKGHDDDSDDEDGDDDECCDDEMCECHKEEDEEISDTFGAALSSFIHLALAPRSGATDLPVCFSPSVYFRHRPVSCRQMLLSVVDSMLFIDPPDLFHPTFCGDLYKGACTKNRNSVETEEGDEIFLKRDVIDVENWNRWGSEVIRLTIKSALAWRRHSLAKRLFVLSLRPVLLKPGFTASDLCGSPFNEKTIGSEYDTTRDPHPKSFPPPYSVWRMTVLGRRQIPRDPFSFSFCSPFPSFISSGNELDDDSESDDGLCFFGQSSLHHQNTFAGKSLLDVAKYEKDEKDEKEEWKRLWVLSRDQICFDDNDDDGDDDKKYGNPDNVVKSMEQSIRENPPQRSTCLWTKKDQYLEKKWAGNFCDESGWKENPEKLEDVCHTAYHGSYGIQLAMAGSSFWCNFIREPFSNTTKVGNRLMDSSVILLTTKSNDNQGQGKKSKKESKYEKNGKKGASETEKMVKTGKTGKKGKKVKKVKNEKEKKTKKTKKAALAEAFLPASWASCGHGWTAVSVDTTRHVMFEVRQIMVRWLRFFDHSSGLDEQRRETPKKPHEKDNKRQISKEKKNPSFLPPISPNNGSQTSLFGDDSGNGSEEDYYDFGTKDWSAKDPSVLFCDDTFDDEGKKENDKKGLGLGNKKCKTVKYHDNVFLKGSKKNKGSKTNKNKKSICEETEKQKRKVRKNDLTKNEKAMGDEKTIEKWIKTSLKKIEHEVAAIHNNLTPATSSLPKPDSAFFDPTSRPLASSSSSSSSSTATATNKHNTHHTNKKTYGNIRETNQETFLQKNLFDFDGEDESKKALKKRKPNFRANAKIKTTKMEMKMKSEKKGQVTAARALFSVCLACAAIEATSKPGETRYQRRKTLDRCICALRQLKKSTKNDGKWSRNLQETLLLCNGHLPLSDAARWSCTLGIMDPETSIARGRVAAATFSALVGRVDPEDMISLCLANSAILRVGAAMRAATSLVEAENFSSSRRFSFLSSRLALCLLQEENGPLKQFAQEFVDKLWDFSTQNHESKITFRDWDETRRQKHRKKYAENNEQKNEENNKSEEQRVFEDDKDADLQSAIGKDDLDFLLQNEKTKHEKSKKRVSNPVEKRVWDMWQNLVSEWPERLGTRTHPDLRILLWKYALCGSVLKQIHVHPIIPDRSFFRASPLDYSTAKETFSDKAFFDADEKEQEKKGGRKNRRPMMPMMKMMMMKNTEKMAGPDPRHEACGLLVGVGHDPREALVGLGDMRGSHAILIAPWLTFSAGFRYNEPQQDPPPCSILNPAKKDIDNDSNKNGRKNRGRVPIPSSNISDKKNFGDLLLNTKGFSLEEQRLHEKMSNHLDQMNSVRFPSTDSLLSSGILLNNDVFFVSNSTANPEIFEKNGKTETPGKMEKDIIIDNLLHPKKMNAADGAVVGIKDKKEEEKEKEKEKQRQKQKQEQKQKEKQKQKQKQKQKTLPGFQKPSSNWIVQNSLKAHPLQVVAIASQDGLIADPIGWIRSAIVVRRPDLARAVLLSCFCGPRGFFGGEPLPNLSECEKLAQLAVTELSLSKISSSLIDFAANRTKNGITIGKKITPAPPLIYLRDTVDLVADLLLHRTAITDTSTISQIAEAKEARDALYNIRRVLCGNDPPPPVPQNAEFVESVDFDDADDKDDGDSVLLHQDDSDDDDDDITFMKKWCRQNPEKCITTIRKNKGFVEEEPTTKSENGKDGKKEKREKKEKKDKVMIPHLTQGFVARAQQVLGRELFFHQFSRAMGLIFVDDPCMDEMERRLNKKKLMDASIPPKSLILTPPSPLKDRDWLSTEELLERNERGL